VFESWCRGDRVPQANARPCGVRRCTASLRCGIHSIHGHSGRLVFGRQGLSLHSPPYRDACARDRRLLRSGGRPRPAVMSMTPAGAASPYRSLRSIGPGRGSCDAHAIRLPDACVSSASAPRNVRRAARNRVPAPARVCGKGEMNRVGFLSMDITPSCFSPSVAAATIAGAA